MNSEAGFDAPQTVIFSDLGEEQRAELVPPVKNFTEWLLWRGVSSLSHLYPGKIPDQLSKNRRTLLQGLKLLLFAADRNGLVAFAIAVFPLFSAHPYCMPDAAVTKDIYNP